MIFLALLLAFQADFQSQFVAGLKALNDNNLAAAQASLLAAGKLQPSNARVWVALAQTYSKLKKPVLAADAALRAEKLGARDPVTLGTLAAYYEGQNKFAKAGDLAALAAAPERAMADYIQANQPKKAIANALATPGWEEKAGIRNLLGKAYEADGQVLKTLDELQAAIRLAPGEEVYWSDLLEMLLDHYNFEEVIKAGQSARQRFPRSADIALSMGIAQYASNQTDAALDSFLETTALDPDGEQSYLFLARLIDDAHGRLQAIIARSVEYEKRNPESYVGYFLHARALIADLEEPEQAEALLRKSIGLNGKFWEAHYRLGILLSNRHAYEAAEKEFRRSVELNPTDPAIHYRLFRTLAALGRTREAEAELAVQRRVAAEHQAELARQTGNVKRLSIQ